MLQASSGLEVKLVNLCQSGHDFAQKSSKIVPLGAPLIANPGFNDF
jgi:hypothetical protein